MTLDELTRARDCGFTCPSNLVIISDKWTLKYAQRQETFVILPKYAARQSWRCLAGMTVFLILQSPPDLDLIRAVLAGRPAWVSLFVDGELKGVIQQ
jgi:hypothetical protein